MRPQARRSNLLVRKVADELVIYDQATHRAHRLNRTAALVWRRCDGLTTIDAIANQLKLTLGAAASPDLVWLALGRLEKANLLREPLARSAGRPTLSRRDALIRLGGAAGAAALLPIVATMVAPTPTMAQSLAVGQCTTNCGGRCIDINACVRDLTCRACIGTPNCSCPGIGGKGDVCCTP